MSLLKWDANETFNQDLFGLSLVYSSAYKNNGLWNKWSPIHQLTWVFSELHMFWWILYRKEWNWILWVSCVYCVNAMQWVPLSAMSTIKCDWSAHLRIPLFVDDWFLHIHASLASYLLPAVAAVRRWMYFRTHSCHCHFHSSTFFLIFSFLQIVLNGFYIKIKVFKLHVKVPISYYFVTVISI